MCCRYKATYVNCFNNRSDSTTISYQNNYENNGNSPQKNINTHTLTHTIDVNIHTVYRHMVAENLSEKYLLISFL